MSEQANGANLLGEGEAILTHQEVTDGLAMEMKMANYTIASQSAEITKLQVEVRMYRKRFDDTWEQLRIDQTNLQIANDKIDRYERDLREIDNTVKEALKECLKQ